MIISKHEFFKAFRDCMTGELSTEDFARKALEYMRSPDYNRWKAETAARELKAAKEGRARLFDLIEEAKKTTPFIDYEITPMKAGYDSLVIMLGGASRGFPSYLDKNSVEEHWADFMEGLKSRRACGTPDCGVSTAIDDETLTFGRGNLDEWGYWEFPCAACAAAYQEKDPKRPVWPVKNASEKGT